MLPSLLFVVQMSARSQIQAGYRAIYGSYLRRDVRGMEPVLAPSYVWKTRHGRTTGRQEVLRQQKAFIATLVSCSKASVHIDRLTVGGPKAVAVVTDHLIAKIRKGSEEKAIESSSTTRDTWVRVGRHWRLAQTEDVLRTRR